MLGNQSAGRREHFPIPSGQQVTALQKLGTIVHETAGRKLRSVAVWVVPEVSVESCLVGVTTNVGMVNCSSCFRTSGQQFFLPASSGVFCSVSVRGLVRCHSGWCAGHPWPWPVSNTHHLVDGVLRTSVFSAAQVART